MTIEAKELFYKDLSKMPKFGTYYLQKKSLFENLPDEKNEIIFLGNSITDGGQWSEMFGNLRIKNRGISGDVTDGVLFRLDEVTASKPKMVFIMIGVNDLARGRSVEYITANYRKIVQRIKDASPKTKIFVQSILPVNPEFNRFKNHVNKTEAILKLNSELQNLTKEFKAQYVDLHSKFVVDENKLNPKYTNDGLHLTGAGYAAWKEIIKNYF
ncbi:MAG: sialate O-acetylesterase [Calditrichaeota bacterium]|nr:MAG: sialate O-acetylesterase [Calditrichota bacterium]